MVLDHARDYPVHQDLTDPHDAIATRNGLSNPDLQTDALNWAAEAKEKGEAQTQTRAVTLVEGLNLATSGSLTHLLANFAPRLKTLVTRWKRGVYRVPQRAESTPIEDSRGEVVRRVGNLQAFLTAVEVAQLAEDYLGGAAVSELAERYGIHRATVSAHLTRRGVMRRPTGLGVEEAAEAVRLHQGGWSMRAIGRIMGVDRRAVKRVLSTSV